MNNSEASALVHRNSKQTSEKLFSCDICGRHFTQAADVTRHTRVHTGERPYTCNICAKGFSQSGDLTRHTRTHTGEKPFSCSICAKSFTQSGSLVRHLRVHTGEKPFSCAVCMRSFSQSGDSIRHIRVHKSHNPVSPLTDKNLSQINIIGETSLPSSEQKFVLSNVVSIAFSQATHVPHSLMTTYTSLPESAPNHEFGLQRNVNGIDKNSSKRS